MSTQPAVFEWIQKYGIKSLLNTPCGICNDCNVFQSHGVERTLGVNIKEDAANYHPDRPYRPHVVGDLCTWKPDGEWDAAYVNCFFCTSNDSKVGDHATAAKNIASWPIRYAIFYDTAIFEWSGYFEEAGWKRLETSNGHEGGSTRVEIWGKDAT